MLSRQKEKNLKIVYTPLHGTGNIPARRILKELGFENVYVVKEQELPDGDFPTVSYPNPEAAEAFELGLKLAKDVDADLVLATDPDADRLGVRVKDKNGEYHDLTGNMSGCLLANYEISQRKAVNGSLPEDGALIKTICYNQSCRCNRQGLWCKTDRRSLQDLSLSDSRSLDLKRAEKDLISLDLKRAMAA